MSGTDRRRADRIRAVRATLIVNPYASAVTEERVRAVERELGAAYELETLLTEGRGHAVELGRGAKGKAIFVFGGAVQHLVEHPVAARAISPSSGPSSAPSRRAAGAFQTSSR